jgi:hypothetical protein
MNYELRFAEKKITDKNSNYFLNFIFNINDLKIKKLI